MSLLFVMANPLPKAFPPIVKAPMVTPIPVVTIVEFKVEFKDNILFVIIIPMEPLTIPQTSPITSLQKLDTFSAFLIKVTASFAPGTLLAAFA